MADSTQQSTSAQQQASKSKPARKRTQQASEPATLAQTAQKQRAEKRKPVFRDVSGIPRVPLADGRVGCVQAEVILHADGSVGNGAYMLTIPKRNADGSESGARYSLADLQLLADGFAAAGHKLV